MGIHVSGAAQRAPRSIAAWILGALSALHGFAAFIFVTGGRTPANELEGFVLGLTAAVLMVGAILSYGLVRLRAELRTATPPR
ncbi:MAG TPA: hypothetical protein VK878_24025 [Candidatus Deferrimicrobiaceae bacterium]|nr:hypothetical protein [Candidatus Deferrimicrobiaceae bacterium]